MDIEVDVLDFTMCEAVRDLGQTAADIIKADSEIAKVSLLPQNLFVAIIVLPFENVTDIYTWGMILNKFLILFFYFLK